MFTTEDKKATPQLTRDRSSTTNYATYEQATAQKNAILANLTTGHKVKVIRKRSDNTFDVVCYGPQREVKGNTGDTEGQEP